MIRNTTADMNDPNGIDGLLLLASGMATGSPTEFIGAQEKQGQAQLVHSDRLPTDTHGTDAEFLALGFTFGEPDPQDPLFRPATLPDGWSKEASDHSMGSYVVDELGRRRVSVFYKAAFYDRKADMRVCNVYSYVHEHGYDGTEIVADDTWATPEAIVHEAARAIEQCDEHAEMYGHERYQSDGFGAKRIAEISEQRARYAALVARYGTTSNDTTGAEK